MVLELGYWKVRGIAGGIKVFLEYVGKGIQSKTTDPVGLVVRDSQESRSYTRKNSQKDEKWTDTFYEAHALVCYWTRPLVFLGTQIIFFVPGR